MCSTGVILSIPFYSLLSQKHKPAFFFSLRSGGGGVISFFTGSWHEPESLADTGAKCLGTTQSARHPNWGVSAKRLPRPCPDVYLVTSFEVKSGEAKHRHSAGAFVSLSSVCLRGRLLTFCLFLMRRRYLYWDSTIWLRWRISCPRYLKVAKNKRVWGSDLFSVRVYSFTLSTDHKINRERLFNK